MAQRIHLFLFKELMLMDDNISNSEDPFASDDSKNEDNASESNQEEEDTSEDCWD